MRARYPDTEGFVERDCVKIAYEVFGSGGQSLVFVPIDPLVHSRAWKAQVPYLAREYRVITVDPRGNAARTGPSRDQTSPRALLTAGVPAVQAAAAPRPGPSPDYPA